VTAFWQQAKKFTVAGAGGTAVFAMHRSAALERLTIWAISNQRVIANMTFQVRINRNNYNAATNVVGAPAADVVYRSGGAVSEDDMIPFVPPQAQLDLSLDPFDFDVLITNNDATAADITMYAVGYGV